jgi:hypothetical protein
MFKIENPKSHHMKKPLLLTLFTALFFPVILNAQQASNVIFTESSLDAGRQSIQQIHAKEYKVYAINLEKLQAALLEAPHREGPVRGKDVLLEIPFPDGSFHTYRVAKNATLHPDLAARFPEIKTYDAYGVSHPGEFAKIDVTPQGFHSMVISQEQGLIFIDPVYKGETEKYIAYNKKDFITNKTAFCSFDETPARLFDETEALRAAPYASCELRKYRLALAATGEYTTFHGGTVALAQAAQATTMNRVNGVYEKNIAITMEIIANNHLLVYTNAATDPYTNGNASTMLTQNQSNVPNVIGSANYDIGHVFGTNSGGVAGLGVVCTNSSKARGVTGSASPIGDPFDIDYVAHEMGHQFGANHTQNNSCNRNSNTAMEPGSASTIMGYAGICSPNVQNNSDAYFHGVSLREIGIFISTSTHTCPVKSSLNNTPPVIQSTNGDVTIPAGTPFALTAIATDTDGDILNYCWEQMNNQTSTQPPVATATQGPNFRSFTPSLNPTRYFPRLSALANNGPFTWEVLPTVGRTMAFRVSVQDNSPLGSCNDYKNVTVTTSTAAGPFKLIYPSAVGITWGTGSTETVTWDVANTNLSPINCATVNIFLSTDGGQSYPHILATGVPNNGSHSVTVPSLPTTTARVMVMSSAGTFFNISTRNFTIATTDYQISTPQNSIITCSTEKVDFTIQVSPVGNYTDPVTFNVSGLPGGAVADFNPISVLPGNSTTLSIYGATGMANGTYNLVVTATSSSGTKNLFLTLQVSAVSGMVSQSGATLTAEQIGVNYQWVDCMNSQQPIAGQTNQSFTPTALSGSYAVQVSTSHCNTTSPCFAISYIGIEEAAVQKLSIYPNPAKNQLMVKGAKANNIASIKLSDVTGRILQEHQALGEDSMSLDISSYNNGMYFVITEGPGGINVTKIIKE